MFKKVAIGILALAAAPQAYAQDSILQAEPFVPAPKVAASTAPTMNVAKPVGPWKTGVIRAKDGQFQYCISEARYSNGKVLVLALNPLGQINVGLGQPGNTTVPTGERNFTIKIDGRYSRTLPAKAMNPELTVVSAGEDKAFMSAFANGSSVSFIEGEAGESFSLKGTSAAISQIRECVEVSMGGAAEAPAGKAPVQVAEAAAPAPEPVVAPAPEVVANNTPEISSETPTETPTSVDTLPAPVVAEAPSEAPIAPLDLSPTEEQVSTPVVTEAPGEDEVRVTSKRESNDDIPLPPTSEPPIQVREEVAPEVIAAAPTEETPVAAAELAPVAPAPETEIAETQVDASASAPVDATPAPITEGKELAMPAPTQSTAALPEVTLPPAEAQAPAAAARILPLPAQLKTLLEGAGLKDVAPLAPSQLSLPADFAWSTGKLQGGVKETVVPAGSDLSNLVAMRLEELASGCEGKPTVKFGRMDKVGALQTQTARLTCEVSGQPQVNSLLFVLSRDGVLSTVFHQGGSRDVPALLKATNGFAASIRNTQG